MISKHSGHMKKSVLLSLLLLPALVSAQVNHDFESGDLSGWTQNAATSWEISNVTPISGTASIHHSRNNTADGVDAISKNLSGINLANGTTTWKFRIKHGFAPSSTNNWGFFLMSNQDANGLVAKTANGYALGVNLSSTDDFIRLWKITGSTKTEIINTSYNWGTSIGTSVAPGIQVTRDADGTWKIFLDADGGFDNLIQIGSSAVEASYTDISNFGIYYKYIASKDMMLWADDISIIGPPDTFAPELVSGQALSKNVITLTFNEALDEISAETISNFQIDNGIGNPENSVLSADGLTLTLTFATDFLDNVNYILSFTGISDLSSNTMPETQFPFVYENIKAISVKPLNINQVEVEFSKPVEVISSSETANYIADGGLGSPVLVETDFQNPEKVKLTFGTNFTLEQVYSLTIQNVEDQFGNIAPTASFEFSFYETQPFDIVINEIMCDLTPLPVAVPAYEYVEIYNNSNYDIDLTGWKMKIGTNSAKTFPAATILAHGYAIICQPEAETALSAFGTVIPFMDENQLTTTGKQIIISRPDGTVIENITYSPDWYNDTQKDDGGWSMERIDYQNFCGTIQNWKACENSIGGTPGFENSVFASNPDIKAPEIEQFIYVNSKQIKLIFSEYVKNSEAQNLLNFTLNNGIQPINISQSVSDESIVTVTFENNFALGTNTLLIKNMSDNCGNVMPQTPKEFEYQLIHPISVEVTSPNQVNVHFSENLLLTSAETEANYFVNNALGNPITATINNADSSIVSLQFATDFEIGVYNTITIDNVQDANSNTAISAQFQFAYYIPKPYDVVFSEIMCDNSPAPLGLPPYKYVEIKNISNYDLDLNGWKFAPDGQSEKTFPMLKLPKNSFLILCEEAAAEAFTTYGLTAGIMSSSDLTISGKRLKLISPQGVTIDEVTYSNAWYGDETLEDGGHSLEKIDLTNQCGKSENWHGCTDVSGGTPGSENSVLAENPYTQTPAVDSVSVLSATRINVYFTEDVSFASGGNFANYVIDNGIGNASTALVNDNLRHISELSFENQLADNQNYKLTISNIANNCGFTMPATDFAFTYHKFKPLELWVTADNQVKIQFSEAFDFESGTDTLNYLADNGLGHPELCARDSKDSSVVYLQFAESFSDGEEITLNLSDISDQNANVISSFEFKFIFYIPKPNDLVINELLFDPHSGGSDFVEIYNRSDNEIDLINFSLARRDKTTNELESILPVSDTHFDIQPQSYLAFTENKDGVMQFYLSQNEDGIIEIKDIPTYDSDGTVVLLYNDSIIIDEFTYSDAMHFELLDLTDGVSLERVNYNKPTQDVNNWHSASEFAGFATPAYKNSQFRESSYPEAAEVYIEPKVFSPDNDGFDDYANIHYNFGATGYVANVYLFDVYGRMLEQLANNVLLASEGSFRWDGVYQTGAKAPVGIYIIYFEAFDLQGNVKKVKTTVTLASKY